MEQQVVQPQFVVMPISNRNALGVFGFFVALIGIFIPTGLIALLGLVISLIAVGRAPRGFASMGVFLGVLGTALWLGIWIIAIVGGAVALLGFSAVMAGAFVLTQPEAVEITSDMINTALVVEEYRDEHDRLPADYSAMTLGLATTIDPWGQKYRLAPLEDHDELDFDLISAGPDQVFESEDDIRLSRLDEYMEVAFEGAEDRIEELFKRLDRMDHHQHGSRHRHGWHAEVSRVRDAGGAIRNEYEAAALRALEADTAAGAQEVEAAATVGETRHDRDPV